MRLWYDRDLEVATSLWKI